MLWGKIMVMGIMTKFLDIPHERSNSHPDYFIKFQILIRICSQFTFWKVFIPINYSVDSYTFQCVRQSEVSKFVWFPRSKGTSIPKLL